MRRSLVLSISLSLTLSAAGCAEGGTARTTDGAVDGAIDAGEGDDGGSVDGSPDDGGGAGAVTIFAIQDPAHPGHVAPGSTVRIEGAVVAALDAFEEEGTGMGHVGDVWIADPAGGEHSGLHVYMPTSTACAGRAALAPGDVVDVTGTVQEFAVPSDGSGRTVTQLVSSTVACTAVGAGAGPAPERITDPTVLTVDATAEAWEGVLVELADVEASAEPDRFGTFPLRVGPAVDDDLYRHAATQRDRFVQLRGIFHYMFGRWSLQPRAADDVVLGAPRTVEDESGAWGCGDGEDSDGDGSVDCDDADCAASLFCRGTRVRVQDVQDTGAVAHPPAGIDVSLIGPLVVTAIDGFAEMTGPGYTGTVVVQDPAATDPRHAGIHVFVPTIEACGAALAVGDRVYVAGRYEEYAAAGDVGGTLTELTGGIVSCRMAGDPIAPTVIASSELATVAGAEPWEGVLVELRDVTVTMPPGTFGRFQVSGGAFVDDDLHRVTVVAGDRLTRIAGIVTYQLEPQLEPRGAADVVIAPSERDATSCGNGIDDDGDGASDCSDLDCCGTTACSAGDLELSEVLYDPASADDGLEWVELHNAGTTPISLACYVLGSGNLSYRYSIAQLPAIVVPPGGCALIGGPDCGGPACTAALDFEPDLHNGNLTAATGVAIFHGLAADVNDASVPVDAVLYGAANTSMLRDESGAIPATADVVDVVGGHSIARTATDTWTDAATPTPGTCL